ncbi:MAG: SusC/RagA family TonB-linked outer membrane protein [Odoribacteraceae bacterium]|jgi:TonB-linked SusC/RagA family outer membrane protein|nr:SusC/RagA family TonB-linked outer membrane protein [Odoribacteraceae bacterium]
MKQIQNTRKKKKMNAKMIALLDARKYFSMTKCLFLFLLLLNLNVYSTVVGQRVAVFQVKNATLEECLKKIEHLTGLGFFYNEQEVKKVTGITLDEKDIELHQLLEKIGVLSGFHHEIVDDIIVLKKRPAGLVSRQQGTVKIEGHVRDENNAPLPGVHVYLKGAPATGTHSNKEGYYMLFIPQQDAPVLVFSFVGMKTREMPCAGKSTVDVIMEENVTEVEEVVITGIFTKARESYTGAVTSITAKELSQVGNRDILSQIRNVDPSFFIVENNSTGSDPNTLPQIQMRGNTGLTVDVKDVQTDISTRQSANLPLFIIDGLEVSLQRVIDLDQNLVENITLLKDASATALYGSRGANGVVMISTRRPAAGSLRFSYKGDVNLELPDLTSYNLLNAQEKLAFEVAAGIYRSDIPAWEQVYDELYNERLTNVRRGVDTYWLKYPVRSGRGHRHSLRAEGGDDHFRYAATFGYNNIVGVMKESYRDTYSGNMFLQYRFEKFSFHDDLSISVNKANNSPYDVFSLYARMNNYWTPYDDEGKLKKTLELFIYPETGQPFQPGNPLYNATLPYRSSSGYTNFVNNFTIEWNILPTLFVRGRFSITKQQGRSDLYFSAQHTSFAGYTEEDYVRRGTYTYGTNETFMYDGDITLNYNQTWNDKHLLYVGLNYSLAEDQMEDFTVQAEGYAATNIIFFGMGNAYKKEAKPQSYESHSRRLGATANINYTYDRRYFADFSGKLEGSSRFGKNNRTAPFWSVGVGWNIHNEPFMEQKEWVRNLRARFSYGVSGSQNFNPYQALRTYRYFENQGYRHWVGAQLLDMGNEDLTWQQTEQLNLGMETTLFKDRLRINVDVYNKMTHDLLSDVNLPLSSGFNSYRANIGEVSNRGVEVSANFYFIRDTRREIVWSAGASLLHNRNRIEKISNSLEFLNEILMEADRTNPSFLFKEGQSLKTIFAVQSLGIDPSSGREIFVKKDGSRTFAWNASDKVPCGVNEPKLWGNLTSMFRYKNLLLNLTFSYRVGGDLYNQTLIDKVENVDPWYNADKRVFYVRWKNPGDHAYFKGVGDQTITPASSRFVMRENTLECRTIHLSYEMNTDWLRDRMGISYLSIGAYSEDVFRLSTIKQERGTFYPFSRKYSFSFTARF